MDSVIRQAKGSVMTPSLRAVGFVLLLALAACGGNGGPPQTTSPNRASTSSPASSSGSSAAGSAEPATTGHPPGAGSGDTSCRPSTSTLRGGEPLGDVDGDSEVDQIYLSEGNIGVEASGGVVSEVPAGRARVSKVIGVADANDDGRGEIFVVGAGASGSEVVTMARIAVLADCRLAFITDASGEGYFFEIGKSSTGGKGLGCVDADGDGRSELVSLSFERNGPVVRWRRTVVNIDGKIATTGPTDEGTFTSPQDDDKIALLSDVTCGDDPLDAELGA